MPEWLHAAIPPASALPSASLLGHLVQSALLGVGVAAIYYLTQRKGRAESASFVATLVLLTILICMVTQVIGNNVARAFSLAGALAIIRFRTVVDDTRDTAFVIAAVVTGMAAGADMQDVALAGLPVLAVTSALLVLWGGREKTRMPLGTLVVRVGAGLDPVGLLDVPLAKHLSNKKIVSAGTAKQGTALELIYLTRFRPGATPLGLIAELSRVEGVQGVEWADNERKKV